MPIDISQYLNLVRSGKNVNTVRGAIANAADAIDKYYGGAGIEQELYDIQNGIYGRDIRAAIYSALDKLSKKEGKSGWPAIADSAFRTNIVSNVGIITDDIATLTNRYSYWSTVEENTATQSLALHTRYQGTFIVACMHRKSVTMSGVDWTRIAQSVPAEYPESDLQQYITVWKKDVSDNYDETVTILQSASEIMQIWGFLVFGHTVVFNVAKNELIAGFPYTPSITDTGVRRLYLISSVDEADNVPAVTTLSHAVDNLGGSRCCAFMDYNRSNFDIPEFETNLDTYYPESAQCLALEFTINGH